MGINVVKGSQVSDVAAYDGQQAKLVSRIIRVYVFCAYVCLRESVDGGRIGELARGRVEFLKI